MPKDWMGVPIEGAMERALAEAEKQEAQTQQQASQTTAQNVEGMVHIPTANIYFAKKRTHPNLTWYKAHEALALENRRMPTIEELRLALSYFKSSNDNELKTLYNEITQVRDPWRANWIDAYFEQRDDGLYMLTKNKTHSEKLEDCLMEDKLPGISMASWLKGTNVTSQGLPKSNISNGKLYFWHPRVDRIARFVANSAGASLVCDRFPDYRNSGLGVFGVADTT